MSNGLASIECFFKAHVLIDWRERVRLEMGSYLLMYIPRDVRSLKKCRQGVNVQWMLELYDNLSERLHEVGNCLP